MIEGFFFLCLISDGVLLDFAMVGFKAVFRAELGATGVD